ncbi:MAG: hypothetical protein AB1640_01670 [bacterium]
MAAHPKPTLRAGAAKRDITPAQDGLWLAGHGRGRRAEGVRDPLAVRTLYLSDGAVELSLSSVDLIGLRKCQVDEIRRRIGDLVPANNVLVFATHTHSAPDTIGCWGPRRPGLLPFRAGTDPGYLERVFSAAVESISEARANAAPANASVACAEMPADLTRNVRRARFKEDNAHVLRLRSEQDKTLAVLINYPCHPQALGPGNRRISADFVADLHRVVEAETGGMSIFLQQALGGRVTAGAQQTPGSRPSPDSTDAAARRLGEAIGTGISEALRNGGRALPPEARLHVTRKELEVPLRNPRLRAADGVGRAPATREELRDRALATETTLIELGPVRMVTVPGEALPELGFQIQAILNCRFPFVLCLGCDELGYILPRRYENHPRYRYERSFSVAPDLGDILLEKIRQMVWKDPMAGAAPR